MVGNSTAKSNNQQHSTMTTESDSSRKFNTLSSKITQLQYTRTKNERELISKTLGELNSINYRYPIVTNQFKAVLLVNQCCSLIVPEDTELVSCCCQLITNLISKQGIEIEGRTLILTVQWCLAALKEQATDVDILVTLDVLLRNSLNNDLVAQVLRSQAVLNTAKNRKCPETAFLALQCLEACTTLQQQSADQLQVYYKIFLDYLLTYSSENNKLISIKILAICLRGLQNIIFQNSDFLHEDLGIILGIIKSFMLFNIEDVEFLKPQKLMPSTLSIPEPTPDTIKDRKGGRIVKQRKPKSSPVTVQKSVVTESLADIGSGYMPSVPLTASSLDELNNSSRLIRSDSDFSDTEGGTTARSRVLSGRVRQAALNLFLVVTNATQNNVIFSYWSSFIPENPHSAKHNLITCVLKETSSRAQLAALNVILSLLCKSKPYLAQAEKGDNLSFTPFSVILGLMLTELHRGLIAALKTHYFPILTQILKCLATLVQGTPYHRLNLGLISSVIRSVKRFVYHKDPAVQVMALIVFGCVIASEPIIQETRNFFIGAQNLNQTEVKQENINSDDDDDNFDYAKFSSDEETLVENNTEVPWLLKRCLFNINNATASSVKIESLQVISAMSRNYFECLLAPHFGSVANAIEAALVDKHLDVRLHAGRTLEFFSDAMNRYLTVEASKVFSLEQCCTFWQSLLRGPLTALLQCEQHSVLRAVGCDCIGSIGSLIFQQLPRDKQILIVTLLFACSRDTEINATGAAVRALAILAFFPPLREDPGYVIDTAEVIYIALQNSNLPVRIKASWSLGNLSNALVLNITNKEFLEELPTNLVRKLLKAAVESSKDNIKVKVNSVRALGNLLQLLWEPFFTNSEIRRLIEEGIDILVKNATTKSNVKTQWNSCYALGSAMKSQLLFSSSIDWQAKVFNALIDLMVNYHNFKVRISAAVALSCPTKREHYGQFYISTWIAAIKALETSQNVENFNEYAHRDHLVDQICLTFGHLATLFIKEDLTILQNYLRNDCLKIQMGRVWERLVPEKSTALSEAYSYVSNFNNQSDLNSVQKATLTFLKDILTQDI